MRVRGLILALCFTFLSGIAAAQTLSCNLQNYKPVEGIEVKQTGNVLTVVWQGESDQQLRAEFTISNGQPVVRQLAARDANGQWAVLGENLTAEFHVTTGKRRISALIRSLMMAEGRYTQATAAFEKWDSFWDAPLVVPGTRGSTDLPRLPSEIKRATVSYNSNGCTVTSTGDRLSIDFNGLTLGIFSGSLRFTAFKGSNLLRQEAIAKTEVPDTAFKYAAGLKGFAVTSQSTVYWRDLAQEWQQYSFDGHPNTEPMELRARNRLEILAPGTGSLAVFPPPHKFFFAREEDTNLGYVYYRKDSDFSFSLGVMQPDRTTGYPPWGDSREEWLKQTAESFGDTENFALYNAPGGTEQHMAVFYYLSPKDAQATQQAVMAYTHGDVYKPVPGFKTIVGHFHFRFNESLRDAHTLDMMPDWVPGYRALGVNIIYLGDFHDDSDPRDSGPKRFMEQKVYFDGAQRMSDKDFLVMPAEEVNSFLGGHWYMLSPKPIYFSHLVPPNAAFPQPFEEKLPIYGTVYHLSSAADVLKFINQTNSLIWTAHPRTKGSEGYPDLYRDKDFFLSDHFIGASWENLPTDLSERTLCPYRCFATEDDMSNWAPTPKYMIAEGDVYWGAPEEESIMYSQLAVNYLKLDRVPLYNQSWAPIIGALRAGNFFGTTGEILFHNWSVEGTGRQRTYHASIEYTFPLDFAELVWGDGQNVGRKIVDLTRTTAFGTKTFDIPFEATGKKWVRFAVWDAAGDGAWANPIQLNE
ncbi:MAG TPA: hypothetical protein VGY31_05625 [Terriglobia bacterium]|nr:hypothetical protein [Terriglobia bacterium]